MNKFSEIKIRSMLLEDLPQIITIEKSRDDLPWQEHIFQGCIEVGYQCLVVEKNHNVIGYAIMGFINDEAHIFNICLLPGQQGKGYGRYIMQRLLANARTQKASRILLKVRESKIIPNRLYSQLGFRVIDCLPDYYDVYEGKENALVFELKLKSKSKKT